MLWKSKRWAWTLFLYPFHLWFKEGWVLVDLNLTRGFSVDSSVFAPDQFTPSLLLLIVAPPVFFLGAIVSSHVLLIPILDWMEKWLKFHVMESTHFCRLKSYWEHWKQSSTAPTSSSAPYPFQTLFFFMEVDRSSEAPTDTKEVFFPQFRAWRLVNDKPLQSNQAINTEVKQVISFIWHFHELFYIF